MTQPTTPVPQHKGHECSADHEETRYFFRPTSTKPFVVTRAAVELYGSETIAACLRLLVEKARRRGGLERLQIFCDPTKAEELWFIDDGDGGAITALLPSDY